MTCLFLIADQEQLLVYSYRLKASGGYRGKRIDALVD